MTSQQRIQAARQLLQKQGYTPPVSSNNSQSRIEQARQLIQQQPQQTTSQPQNKPGFLKSVARGLLSPLITSGTRIGQAIAPLFGAKASEVNSKPITTHIPVLGDFTVKPLNSFKQAVGEEAQTAALAIRNPITAGATTALGSSLENNDTLGKTIKNTAIGAGIGLGSQLIGKAAAKALAPAAGPLERSAERSYAQALGATTKANKELSDKVVPGLIQRGEKTVTRAGLLSKAEQGITKSGEALEEAYNKLPAGTRVNVRPVFDKLQNIKQQYVVAGTNQVGDDAAYNAIENMQRKLLSVSDESVSVDSIRSFRQILDKATKRTGKSFALSDADSAIAEARKATANAIRSQLAAEHPDIAKINSEFNFWSNVQKVVGDTIQRTKGQNSLGNQLATEGGAIVGATLKGTIGNVILGAATLKYLRQAIQSTAWRTTSALAKGTIANALARGDIAAASTLLQKIISANQSQRNQK